jgi:hypothetical protein
MALLKKADVLERQIADRRREIATERYGMSIGELTNMYKENELEVHPEFQRFFRWDGSQKSRLIESILLGIPLPPIFVAQTETGGWELVDGLQRVSTLLELQGLLVGEERTVKPQLQLVGTKYLPALEGRFWDNPPLDSLTHAQRLDIRRARIDVQIIQRQSSPDAKYDLFQRLNSYGSQLTPQELRSCLLVSVNPNFLSWVERITSYQPFEEAVKLSERLVSEQYDIELALRFLVLHDRQAIKPVDLRGFTQVLDDATIKLARAFPGNRRQLDRVFRRTFDVIADRGGENVFRKWDIGRSEFVGSFLNTSYEVFAMGLGYHVASRTSYREDLIQAAQELWAWPTMQKNFATGISTEVRLSRFLPIGRELLAAR